MKQLRTIIYKTIYIGLFMLNTAFLSAQEVKNNKVEVTDQMADVLAGNYKFNVVATVLIIIFLGAIIYINRLDKRITKIENQK